jgi:hypothetical protein
MSASLSYYISEGLLTGLAAGHMVSLRAMSGGGGGSTKHGGNTDTNNPSSTGLKETSAHRGGPLPAGRYKIAAPSRRAHLGLCAELDPYDKDQGAHMFGRGGFFIHGRGPLGSDGCIVPMESFAELMGYLTKDRGGVLVVFATMVK